MSPLGSVPGRVVVKAVPVTADVGLLFESVISSRVVWPGTIVPGSPGYSVTDAPSAANALVLGRREPASRKRPATTKKRKCFTIVSFS